MWQSDGRGGGGGMRGMQAARAVSGRVGQRKGTRMLTLSLFFPFPIQRIQVLDAAKKTKKGQGGGRGSTNNIAVSSAPAPFHTPLGM